MRKINWALTSLLLPTTLALPAWAAGLQRDFRSAHALGAGDTGVASVEGSDAIFYNPAGMAQSKTLVSEVLLASPQFTVSDTSASLYKDIKAKKETTDLVQKYNNKPIHAGIQNFSGVVFKRAAFGLLQQTEFNASAGNDPKRGLRARASAVGLGGAYFALARPFLGDSLFLGTTVKVVHKGQADFDLGPLDAEKLKGSGAKSLLKDSVRRGTGAGADFGMMWRATDAQIKPALGVVVRNVGMNYNLGASVGKPLPTKEPTVVDVGITCEPGTKRSSARLSIDLRDASNTQKVTVFKRLHAGAELSFQSILGVMGGLNQGYPTYGAYLALKVVRIEAGSYSEELGVNPGDQRGRRFFGRVSVGWVQ